ncbi:MAG: neocarzinostatin apoprotein domain-containing protein [Acidimicrobiales bacterium]
MTDADDRELELLDRAARAASRGLRAHVDRHVDPELMLTTLPAATPTRHGARLLAAAAVAALFIGSVAVLGDDGGGRERSRLEVDEDGDPLPPPAPGVLTPLGPNDGRDSVQLPITVEPHVDLQDRQVVTATAGGFVPGEQVGIVQCAREAGGEVRERRAGIDGCDVGGVEYADADPDGVATGTFTVKRVLTTAATGTVDCALEAERCIVAMGAVGDYDRSGGLAVTFVGGGEPIDVPTFTVAPPDGLVDGDTVHVTGEGFEPEGLVYLNVCSLDPSSCWATGETMELDSDNVKGAKDAYGEATSFLHLGLLADGDGRIEGDVPVWRYLPAGTAGTYADCAVSQCTLRVSSDVGYAPAPAPLGFAAGGTPPQPPAIAVDTTRDLAPGQKIVVRGAGFQPGSSYNISLCAAAPGQPENTFGCQSTNTYRIDDDGGFAREFEVPDLRSFGGGVTATTVCAAEGDCGVGGQLPSEILDALSEEIHCDGVEIECTIRVDTWNETGQAIARPVFPPAPVVVTMRQ